MIKKLDKYILSEFWLPLVAGAGIITGVWLGIDKFKDVFKLLAKSGAPIATGVVVLGLEIPHILSITLPISILLATFLTFQKLSSQSEIIAIRAAGVSFTRLMRPVIFLGLIGAALSFFLSEFVVPITTPFAKKIYTLALYKDPISTKGVAGFSYFERDSDDAIRRIFYVKTFKKTKLSDILILDFSKNNTSMIHTAQTGKWDPEQGGWVLYDGMSSYIKLADQKKRKKDMLEGKMSGESHLVTTFQKTFIPSSLNPNEILNNINNVRDMNFLELRHYIGVHEKGRIITDKLDEFKTKYFNKYAYPFSCLMLAVIGACLGITGRRRAINWGYIVIGLVVFVFYMSESMFDSFGSSGRIMPVIAVWLPNLVLAVIALSAYLYRARI